MVVSHSVATPLTASAHPATIVLTGGLAAGTFDIVYACTFWAVTRGVAPTRIFQSVAAGLLGSAAFDGGAATAALGLALHYCIAITMAFTYYLLATRWSALSERPVFLGASYGLLLYGVMNYVVVPLSRARPAPPDPVWISLSILVHAFLVGVPIALFTRRALRRIA
jgi:hypothetical protein